MDKLYGYRGQFLLFDLSDGRSEVLSVPAAQLRSFIGGSSLWAKMLLDRFEVNLDPLDARAPLAFVCGPPAMMKATVAALRACRFPRRRIFTERFAL